MIDTSSPSNNPFSRMDRGQCPDLDCRGTLRLAGLLSADCYLYSCRLCGHEAASSTLIEVAADS
jgi:hypothetical protein